MKLSVPEVVAILRDRFRVIVLEERRHAPIWGRGRGAGLHPAREPVLGSRRLRVRRRVFGLVKYMGLNKYGMPGKLQPRQCGSRASSNHPSVADGI